MNFPNIFISENHLPIQNFDGPKHTKYIRIINKSPQILCSWPANHTCTLSKPLRLPLYRPTACMHVLITSYGEKLIAEGFHITKQYYNTVN